MRYYVLSVLILLAVAGCQKENNKSEQKAAADTVRSELVEIVNPWIRPANEGSNTALFFGVYNNTGEADTLVSADSEIAKKVEVHETYRTDKGMMGMRHVDFVIIPPGDTVIFKPRDLHVMFVKLYNDVLTGDSSVVSLSFSRSGKIEIQVPVRDMIEVK